MRNNLQRMAHWSKLRTCFLEWCKSSVLTMIENRIKHPFYIYNLFWINLYGCFFKGPPLLYVYYGGFFKWKVPHDADQLSWSRQLLRVRYSRTLHWDLLGAPHMTSLSSSLNFGPLPCRWIPLRFKQVSTWHGPFFSAKNHY